MSDQIVLAFGWSAAIDKEILRLQMMKLARGERPMVRELRPLVISVTDENEAEFMSRFHQFSNLDEPNMGLGFFPKNRAWFKHKGLILVRWLLLLPLRLLGFTSPLKVPMNHTFPYIRETVDPRSADAMVIENELVGFVSLGRRKNDFDKNGVEMR